MKLIANPLHPLGRKKEKINYRTLIPLIHLSEKRSGFFSLDSHYRWTNSGSDRDGCIT
jgi:hypothetical protein